MQLTLKKNNHRLQFFSVCVCQFHTGLVLHLYTEVYTLKHMQKIKIKKKTKTLFAATDKVNKLLTYTSTRSKICCPSSNFLNGRATRTDQPTDRIASGCGLPASTGAEQHEGRWAAPHEHTRAAPRPSPPPWARCVQPALRPWLQRGRSHRSPSQPSPKPFRGAKRLGNIHKVIA